MGQSQKGEMTVKQQLNYRFINPNSEEETIKKLISICIAANTKKIEDALLGDDREGDNIEKKWVS